MTQPDPTPTTQVIVAPISGTLVPLGDVPDPLFSAKTLGDGFAVAPDSDNVVSPVSGTVQMVFETGHAFGVTTPNGIEILVHLGIDTVQLNGVPFSMSIKSGDEVSAGQPVGTMDRAAVVAAGKDTTTMVILTKTPPGSTLGVQEGPISAGQVAANLDIPAVAPVPVAAAAAPVPVAADEAGLSATTWSPSASSTASAAPATSAACCTASLGCAST